MEKEVKLIELANTWQGEGPDTGRQMLLARYKLCNLACPFCDTMIKMKTTLEGSFTIDHINNYLEKTKGLMITGGEPTFKDNYDQTLLMLKDCNYQLANVETNGFDLQRMLQEPYISSLGFANEGKMIKFMYSPKVYNKALYKKELKNSKEFIKNPLVYFKIVVDQDSVDLIKEIGNMDITDRGKIYLMPMGVTSEEIANNWEITIDLADMYNFNLSSRMHIMNNFT